MLEMFIVGQTMKFYYFVLDMLLSDARVDYFLASNLDDNIASVTKYSKF